MTKNSSVEVFNCAQLHEAVQNTYPAESHLYMREVRDATGFDAVRSADAIAVGMYHSCGRLIRGFEMKVSRYDWLKELKQPAKSESLLRYCHRWALIAAKEDIVQPGELPEAWGFGVPHRPRANAALRIRWIVEPPKLDPIPWNMVFITALLQAAKVPRTNEDMQRELEKRYEDGRKDELRYSKELKQRHEAMKEQVERFEIASGIPILGQDSVWSKRVRAEQLAAFKKFQEREAVAKRETHNLPGLLVTAERIVEAIKNVLKEPEYEQGSAAETPHENCREAVDVVAAGEDHVAPNRAEPTAAPLLEGVRELPV